MRNAGPMCLSQYVKQPDFQMFRMKEFIHTPEFCDHVRAATAFMRQNKDDIDRLHELWDDEIHNKRVELREQGTGKAGLLVK
jgi:hypothetical protein